MAQDEMLRLIELPRNPFRALKAMKDFARGRAQELNDWFHRNFISPYFSGNSEAEMLEFLDSGFIDFAYLTTQLNILTTVAMSGNEKITARLLEEQETLRIR